MVIFIARNCKKVMAFLKKSAFLAAALIVMASCAKCPDIPVEGGLVRGVRSGTTGVTVFKGIPYAAPPVDSLRWREPAPVIPWEGVRVADKFGPVCWQEDLSDMPLYGREFYSGGMPEMSEDCLYLNVWAPTGTVGDVRAKLPVAVWIHGGAFDHGYGSEVTMDGSEWARRGVILVTINYRVGMMGFYTNSALFAESPVHRSGNFGIYDQNAALRWVSRNIGRFGGDPRNITVMGQSAGARSVKTLVSSPIAKPRIAKAIIQSGGGISVVDQFDRDNIITVRQKGDAFMKYAGYDSLAQMKAASPQELMQKYNEYVADGGELTFGPVSDFYLVGTTFTASVVRKGIADIPYMIGYTAGDGDRKAIEIDEFCASRNYYEGKPVYQYKFDRQMPGDDAGAFHSSELWYMFGTLDKCWRPLTRADKALSAEMLDAWTNFCKYGDPEGAEPSGSWPEFTKDNPYRKIFDVK